MIVTLKQFCEETGFPRKMIKTHAKSGLLPYIPCGRRYLFDKEETLRRLELLKAVPIYEPPKVKRERRRNVNRLPTEYTSGTEYLKAKLKQRKTASRASADGRAGNDKTGGLNKSLIHIIP